MGSLFGPNLKWSAKVDAPGLVNLLPAVAYHFCPSSPAFFTQPGASTLAELCTCWTPHACTLMLYLKSLGQGTPAGTGSPRPGPWRRPSCSRPSPSSRHRGRGERRPRSRAAAAAGSGCRAGARSAVWGVIQCRRESRGRIFHWDT